MKDQLIKALENKIEKTTDFKLKEALVEKLRVIKSGNTVLK